MVVFWAAVMSSIVVCGIGLLSLYGIFLGNIQLRSNNTVIALAMGLAGIVQIWGNAFIVLSGAPLRDEWLVMVPLSMGAKPFVLLATWRLFHVASMTTRAFRKWKYSGWVLTIQGLVLLILGSVWIAAPGDMTLEVFRGTYMLVAWALPTGLAAYLGIALRQSSPPASAIRDVVLVSAVVTTITMFTADLVGVVVVLSVFYPCVLLRLLGRDIYSSFSPSLASITLDTPNVWDIYYTNIIDMRDIAPALDFFLGQYCTDEEARRWHQAKLWQQAKWRAENPATISRAAAAYRSYRAVDTPEAAVIAELEHVNRRYGDHLRHLDMQGRLHDIIKDHLIRKQHEGLLLCGTEEEEEDPGVDLDDGDATTWSDSGSDSDEIIYVQMNEIPVT